MASLNLAARGTGEIIQIGPVNVRELEDGSRTDNRIGAVEISRARPNARAAPACPPNA
jgi:hypothetical protein